MATLDDVATLMLQDLGAPTTPDNIKAMKIWISAENSNPTLRNNPLNLHSSGGLPGQTGSDYVNSSDQNVAVFDTIQHGVQANANNLLNLSQSHPEYGYGAVVSNFRAGNGYGALVALGNSFWAGSRYRAKDSNGNYINGTNTLVDRFLSAGGTASGNTGGTGTLVSAVTNSVANFLGLSGPDASKPLDTATAQAVAHKYAQINGGGDARATEGAYNNIFNLLQPWIGTPLNQVPFNVNQDGTNNGQIVVPSPSQQQSGDITRGSVFQLPDLTAALLFLGVILVGIVFVGSGAIITLKRREA